MKGKKMATFSKAFPSMPHSIKKSKFCGEKKPTKKTERFFCMPNYQSYNEQCSLNMNRKPKNVHSHANRTKCFLVLLARVTRAFKEKCHTKCWMEEIKRNKIEQKKKKHKNCEEKRFEIAMSTNYAWQNCKLAKMVVSISWLEFNLKVRTPMTENSKNTHTHTKQLPETN